MNQMEEKSTTLKTTNIDSTKMNQMEKSGIKDKTRIDSTKESKYDLALQILLLVLVVTLGVTLAFHMFYVHEDTAVLHDPKFRIEMVSHSSFSVLTVMLILHNPDNWNLTFSVLNPNSNYDFYHDDLKASISYYNTLLWSANVAGKFYQDARAQTSNDSTFGALPEPYVYWIGTYIAGDFAYGQTTTFYVSLNGKIEISDHKSPSQKSCRELHVSCDSLRAEFLEDTQTEVLAVDSKACAVISQDSSC